MLRSLGASEPRYFGASAPQSLGAPVLWSLNALVLRCLESSEYQCLGVWSLRSLCRGYLVPLVARCCRMDLESFPAITNQHILEDRTLKTIIKVQITTHFGTIWLICGAEQDIGQLLGRMIVESWSKRPHAWCSLVLPCPSQD